MPSELLLSEPKESHKEILIAELQKVARDHRLQGSVSLMNDFLKVYSILMPLLYR